MDSCISYIEKACWSSKPSHGYIQWLFISPWVYFSPFWSIFISPCKKRMRLLCPGRESLNKICATVSGPVPSYSSKKDLSPSRKAAWRVDHCSASTGVFQKHLLRDWVSLTGFHWHHVVFVVVVITKRGPVEILARKEKKEVKDIRGLRWVTQRHWGQWLLTFSLLLLQNALVYFMTYMERLFHFIELLQIHF